jgi:hypothetical protein
MLNYPATPETLAFIAQVEQLYASLMQCASPGVENLGGKLLYAGELSTQGCALTVAANIAGAASLAATADTSAQKQAIREGAADFLVTNLDEALRILKNEIRKREPVSVAVSVAPEAVLKEMLLRGVLPDLLPPVQSTPAPSEFATFLAQGAQPIAAPTSRPARLLIWQIPAEFAQRPAEFDAFLKEHIHSTDHATLRWLRLAPRYLGPHSRRLRSITCDEETASKLIDVLGPPLQN